jgi:hypothetical protein
MPSELGEGCDQKGRNKEYTGVRRVQESYRGNQEGERDCLLRSSHRCQVEREEERGKERKANEWLDTTVSLSDQNSGKPGLGHENKECGERYEGRGGIAAVVCSFMKRTHLPTPVHVMANASECGASTGCYGEAKWLHLVFASD